MSLQRDGWGTWVRAYAEQDRRITGLIGLSEPCQRLRSSGPAQAVLNAAESQGYDDHLGAEIIGTFANCGGGITPGSTVLSLRRTFSPRCRNRSLPMEARLRHRYYASSVGTESWVASAMSTAWRAINTDDWWR